MNLLFDDYYFSIIDEKEFSKIFRENIKSVYEGVVDFNVHQMLSELEVNKIKNLKNNLSASYKLYIKICKSEKIIGWLFGCQTDNESFTMMNSGILKEYRNKGIYSKVLKEVLDILSNEGFQKVESQHQTSNNSVIIPKLKAGFTITGLEIDEKVGMRVRLTYYFNKMRNDTLNFRIGSKKLNKEFEKYFSLWEE